MFTREHFEKIAAAIAEQRASDSDQDSAQLVETLADIFAESNERFSRAAFIAACNAEPRAEIRRHVAKQNVKTIARNKARAKIGV